MNRPVSDHRGVPRNRYSIEATGEKALGTSEASAAYVGVPQRRLSVTGFDSLTKYRTSSIIISSTSRKRSIVSGTKASEES